MKVIVDSRFQEDKLFKEIAKYCKPSRIRLKLGDVWTKNAIIERKSINDFGSSIIDQRLFDQMNRLMLMQKKKEKPVFLVVHDYHLTNPRIKMNQVEGAIASVAMRYGVPLLWMPNLEVAGRVMYKLCKKADEGKWLLPRKVWKRSHLAKKTPAIVKCVKIMLGVPAKVATKLLRKYGSVHNIAHAKIEDLVNIPGVAKTRATRIKTRLNKDWRKKV